MSKASYGLTDGCTATAMTIFPSVRRRQTPNPSPGVLSFFTIAPAQTCNMSHNILSPHHLLRRLGIRYILSYPLVWSYVVPSFPLLKDLTSGLWDKPMFPLRSPYFLQWLRVEIDKIPLLPLLGLPPTSYQSMLFERGHEWTKSCHSGFASAYVHSTV